MQKNSRYAVGPLLLVLLVLCGCSPQKSLVRRLKGADRVLVTSVPARGPSITVTGEEVDKLIKAFAVGKKENPLIDAAVDYRLEFYKGTQHLETVTCSDQVFWAGTTPYSDTTETLKGIYQKSR